MEWLQYLLLVLLAVVLAPLVIPVNKKTLREVLGSLNDEREHDD